MTNKSIFGDLVLSSLKRKEENQFLKFAADLGAINKNIKAKLHNGTSVVVVLEPWV